MFLFIESCTEGALRLVNGSSMYEGRVEICQHSVWGTICDDLISRIDARVACRNLGLSERCKSAILTLQPSSSMYQKLLEYLFNIGELMTAM